LFCSTVIGNPHFSLRGTGGAEQRLGRRFAAVAGACARYLIQTAGTYPPARYGSRIAALTSGEGGLVASLDAPIPWKSLI
jgi:hypothetical protein